MRSIVIGFGLMIFCLLLLFKLAEVNFVKGNVRLELVVAFFATLFFFIGLYFNYRSNNRAGVQPVTSSEVNQPATPDYGQLKKIGLTQRELEVLAKMAEGCSNQEIASQLFLSESTIKTHVSNILFKLDVKRRTQAIQVARQLRLLA